MTTLPRAILAADLTALLDLNRRHEIQLSPMTGETFAIAVAAAWHARCFPQAAGFMLAYDQSADLPSPNFQWFKRRYGRFIYVDRIVVAETARGRGLARAFYADLMTRAVAAGERWLAAEVNVDPPNPASSSLHDRLGFLEVGRGLLVSGKTVAYLMRDLSP